GNYGADFRQCRGVKQAEIYFCSIIFYNIAKTHSRRTRRILFWVIQIHIFVYVIIIQQRFNWAIILMIKMWLLKRRNCYDKRLSLHMPQEFVLILVKFYLVKNGI